MKKTSTILAIGSALAMGSAQAEIESSFHVGYNTEYVFRGLNVNDFAGFGSGMYEYGLDFSGDCNCGATWNAGIWQADIGSAHEERDLYASMTKSVGAFDVTAGFIRYDYSGSVLAAAIGDTSELFLGASTELAGLTVAGTVYYDVDALDGNIWGELSVGKSFDVGGATLDLSANFGTTLDAGLFGDNYTTYGLKAALSKELGDNLTGSIYVAAEQTDGFAGAFDGDDVYGGASIAFAF
ncbi:MAG: hypothetical protein ACSHYF_07905 [Verrucomicrobiaceae bacterium]